MPTSSGPNQTGEENLVFAYDVGDVKNSYRGEPTVNFITELGDPVQEIARGEFGQYFNLVPVFETHGLVPYTLSMEMKGNIPGQCLVYMQNGSYTKYGFVGSWVTLTTEWQRFVFSNLTPAGPNANWQANTPNDHRAMLATYTVYGSGRNPTIRNIQLEHGAHSTPFIAGTRSTVEGLIDLTGNSSIDLANVSFDSNAQMLFDGTNDYVNMGDLPIIKLGTNFTIEAVVKPEQDKWMYFFHKGYGQNNSLAWGRHSSGDNWFFSTMINGSYQNSYMGTATLNQYCHLAASYDGANLRLYENGDLQATVATTHDMMTSTQPLGIGGPGRYWNGEIPVTKIYNKALTAQEVKQNYQQYKTRFNLS